MVKPPVLDGFKPDAVIAKLPKTVQVFMVGGAVRDALVGRTCCDKDWVVVGATVEDMQSIGLIPVGTDFPVFIHPETKEEYALARTERKSGHGYKGFTFHAAPAVSLEEDLARRDFTINAMAMSASGELIDPYGGWIDLQSKLFRHISPSFVEDPLRVLRLARFLARFIDFTVAIETVQLCRMLRNSGELKNLVAERIYAELNKGMKEEKPSRMIKFLNELNVWGELVPEICTVPFLKLGEHEFDQLNMFLNALNRWVYLIGFFLSVNQIKRLVKVWRIPREIEDLSILASNYLFFLNQGEFDSIRFSAFFLQVDLYRKPERLSKINGLVYRVFANIAVSRFIEIVIAEVQKGHYKSFVSTRIANVQGGEHLSLVVAEARKTWVQALHAEFFHVN
jgi:tRNA nucleotidyltransferase (CCA-adding enzyme)